MRGFLVSFGIHAAGVLGLVVLPSFSASQLPPPRLPPIKVYDPVVPRVDLASAQTPRPSRRTSIGGGGVTGPPRPVDDPAIISDAPLLEGVDEPPGDPGLPPGPGSPSGSELLPGPPVVAQAAPQLVRANVDVQPPRRLTGASPVYPPLARATRTEGVVVLECTIGTDDRVGDVRITRSHPLFDGAAYDAVLTWRYTPTLLRGVPVAVLMTVTVEFKLNR